MPIYAYRCSACGHAQDVLQRMSDPVLTTCPDCGAEAYTKQLTAAGFQLKGSGWYVTDFRDGNKSKPKSDDKPADAAAAGGEAKPADGAAPAADSKPADKAADKPTTAAPAPSAAPATSPIAAATPKPAGPSGADK